MTCSGFFMEGFAIKITEIKIGKMDEFLEKRETIQQFFVLVQDDEHRELLKENYAFVPEQSLFYTKIKGSIALMSSGNVSRIINKYAMRSGQNTQISRNICIAICSGVPEQLVYNEMVLNWR